MRYINKNLTLYETLFKQKNVFLDISMMLLAVISLAILSNIYIPLWPVPITCQTFGIFLIAFFFGSRKGTLTIGLYTLAGLLGFGVFTQNKSGLAPLMGPTVCYIVGLFITFFVIGTGHNGI
jgi:biotin transport system substrate-specific component